MIINHTQENPAVMSNVGEIGEFRIRNSAKAFSILSSGLYANKIRAIIRELSCNAVDSHVAAGQTEVPFEVHLPAPLEPWFAVRDFGTGLNHDQVTNIYTTYFESTKTASNEFIGALGLGSKSPFSYTDNFTVTAVQSGTKRIYSAFINEAGVPSVALMGTSPTDEPNGVEVKFSVSDRYDFSKFQDEARSVFAYFKHRPVITGIENFKFTDIEIVERDIIPGVHRQAGYWHKPSVAVMGNIAYPIQIPNEENNLGHLLARMLECNLELHFDIGELDFQASREGLSYIPQTIDSIKRKLEQLQAHLATHIANKADAISNLWERALYLNENSNDKLYGAAVKKYAADTKFVLTDNNANSYNFLKEMVFSESELAEKYNLQLRPFVVRSRGIYDAKTTLVRKTNKQVTIDKQPVTVPAWSIRPAANTIFVKNELKTGALTRARYHYGNHQLPQQQTVYLMESVVKSKPADFDQFLADIHNPPTVVSVDTLDKKERVVNTESRKQIMCLGKTGSYPDRYTWTETNGVFEDDKTYFYLPLVNRTAECKIAVHQLKDYMMTCGIADLRDTEIYGVRKNQMKDIEGDDNWVNLEEWLQVRMASVTESELDAFARSGVDKHRIFQHTANIGSQLGPLSPYAAFIRKLMAKSASPSFRIDSLERLCATYGKKLDLQTRIKLIEDEINAIYARYPLLKELGVYCYYNIDAVTQYINLIDNANKQGA